jgi:uncharacterized protein (TIGR00730 family)
VFAGSSSGTNPAYARAAGQLAQALVKRGVGIVYGGGHSGLMGTLADAGLAAGGEVIGVMPRALVDRERSHQGLTQLHIVDGMHERKALMAELSTAFVALPGGIGTLEELTEVFTWSYLRFHHKRVGVLDVEGYWAPLFATLDRMVDGGFLPRDARGLLLRDTQIDPLLDRLLS